MNRFHAILPLLLSCCFLAPDGERTAASVQGFTDAEPVVDLSTDPRFVLRQRLTADEPSDPRVRFAHRSRQWQVFPLTLYPRTEVKVTVDVHDPRMADRTGLWLFGPMKGDGSWGAPQRIVSRAGVAEIAVRPRRFGQYAIVVGAKSAQDFQARYPGHYGVVRASTGGPRMSATFTVSDDGSAEIYVNDGTPTGTYTIEEPLPSREARGDVTPGAVFRVRGADGQARTFELVSWTTIDNYILEDAADLSDSRIGINEDGGITIEPGDPTLEQRVLIVDAIGSDGRPARDRGTNPALLTVVPEEHDGRRITIRAGTGCSDASCRVPVYQDDGSAVSADLVFGVKPIAFDNEETSTYGVSVEWRTAAAGGAAVARAYGDGATVTRYPVYFAHGFNTQDHTWQEVLTTLRAHDASWNEWAHAGSVPRAEPLPERAEQLRRNLTAFLADLPVPEGEPFLRVNVIGHSMGGLDARYLVGAERYNERCTELLCTDEAGRPEACCPTGANGQPIMWRDRVASLTTLSAPHLGSGFADWGMGMLQNALIDWAFQKASKFLFKLDSSDPGAYAALLTTIETLSRAFAEREIVPTFPVPNRGRQYSWACAIGEESCAQPDLRPEDRPRQDADGFLLPAPSRLPTVFSWAAISCPTGNCGDVLDPKLLLSYAKDDRPSDGLVTVESARFGIYMGVRSNDHIHWTKMTYSFFSRVGQTLFGVRSDPVDDWHIYWLGELARAGY